MTLVIHFLGEKSILPNFSMLRGVAILDCESHSQAGSTSPHITLSPSLFNWKGGFECIFQDGILKAGETVQKI